MITALEMIEGASKLAGVLATGQKLKAEMAKDGLEALNQLLHSWELEGLLNGHSTLKLTDTVYIPEPYERGVKFNLAMDIAADIPLTPSQYVIQTALDQKTIIGNYDSKPRLVSVDSALLGMSANRKTS